MREIKGYEGHYSINETGEIFNIQTGKKKKSSLGNHGYYVVDLFKNNKRKTYLVHRLVADAFLENPQKKRTVNHKDGNRQNNHIENLEWATYSENIKHSYGELGRKAHMTGRIDKLNHNSKPVLMLSLEGVLINKFDSIMGAERKTGVLNNAIVAHLKGRSSQAGGYIWRYADEPRC